MDTNPKNNQPLDSYLLFLSMVQQKERCSHQWRVIEGKTNLSPTRTLPWRIFFLQPRQDDFPDLADSHTGVRSYSSSLSLRLSLIFANFDVVSYFLKSHGARVASIDWLSLPPKE